MKLLVVGHTYVRSFYQGKYAAMKRLNPGLQLRLVVPHETTDVFNTSKPEVHAGLEPADVVALPAYVNRSHMTRVLHPTRLAALMKAFEPDHIHIEEDPHSLLGFETVCIAQRACSSASVSFFIWDNLARTPQFPLNIIKRALTSHSFAGCRLVVCGNSEAQTLLKEVKGYSLPSVVLPQVGLDPNEYMSAPTPAIMRQLKKSSDMPLIGFVGRLVPEKGVLLLLEALSRLLKLEWRLLIIGNGALRSAIVDRWQDRFGDRMAVMEAVPHKTVSQYLRCLDVFVLPSYQVSGWKEQFGLTMAQAMMAGIPCIGSSSGAIPEVLGSAGLIFREKDVDDLTRALQNLLKSEALRKDLGERGRRTALDKYDNSTVAAGYLAAFHSLV